MPPAIPSDRFAARLIAEVTAASIGAGLLACAVAADQRWLDRHFLPTHAVSRQQYVLVESFVRVAAAALGTLLALIVRPRIGRLAARVPAGTLVADALRVSLAVTLALGTSELVLRRTFRRATEEQPADQEPFRRADARLGWVFVPARTGRDTVGGRVIEYTFDAAGYRVRRINEPVDPERPTIIFTGESIMVGHGLTWDESIPAQVGALLGTQTANLAVHGYASDQAYLRLLAELPRFRRPVAVVSLFMPSLFDRNLDDDRPRLGPGLEWMPAEHRWRLAALARLLVPYRSDEAIERGLGVTRMVLCATVELARARAAIPLIVVPQFGAEEPVEGALRQRLLDDAGLPYVHVELDRSWRLRWNRHPDPRAARAIAGAVVERLRDR